ncbi:MAG: hypothetical protein ACLQGP_16240 [Isosphaeraceae bacterium]
MHSRYLLIVTAAVEIGAGLPLAIWPSGPVALLTGSTSSAIEAMTIGRIAGAALISLGTACWLSRNDDRSLAARGLIAALLVYNTGAIAILTDTGIVSERVGVAVWPGVLLHTALACWCIACLRTSRRGV